MEERYREFRVNNLPSTGLVAGDKYYLLEDNNTFTTYIVNKELELVKEAGTYYIPVMTDDYFDK